MSHMILVQWKSTFIDVHTLDSAVYLDALNKYLPPVAGHEIEACWSEGGSVSLHKK